MTTAAARRVEHTIDVAAPADDVYRLLADVTQWPRIFPPTIYVERREHSADEERIRIWATANGEPKTWASRRRLDARARRIEFRQEVSTPPVAQMGGAWIIEELPDGRSHVRLLHDYRSIDDDPEGLEWIDQAVDRNSRSELEALKSNVEFAHAAEELTFSFADTVHIAGAASDAFDFVNEAQHWPQRLPHVADVRFGVDDAGLQTLEMDTRAPDGSVHTTKSYRVTFGTEKIAYKQVTLPALMTLHTGYWTFVPDGSSVAATSQHTVVLDVDNIRSVLGSGAGVAEAKEYVREALSANSRATLGHAKAYAEDIRRR